jgi:hypothetical protein
MPSLLLNAQREASNSFGLTLMRLHASEIMGKRPFITLIISRKNGLLGVILLAFTP